MDDRPRRTYDKHGYLSPVAVALALLSVSLAISLPILHAEFLPLTDLPNHIARHFIATMGPGPLDDYYAYTFALVPNTAADLAWLLFGGGGDPAAFARYTIAFYLFALVAATMFLARVVHGHWTLWSAAVGLVAYNANFFWGFQNYIVTMPFAIFVLALWLWSERLTVGQRLALLSPLIAGLYVLHLFAFVFLATAAFGRELQLLIERKGERK